MAGKSALLQMGLYKRQQGRVARQATFAAMVVAVVLGAYRLAQWLGFYQALSWFGSESQSLEGLDVAYRLGVPSFILIGGLWLSFRLVNMPRFADFLISVEAEMNKVSWPNRGELFRSSMVVLFTIFFMATVLYFFDISWSWIFTQLGIRS